MRVTGRLSPRAIPERMCLGCRARAPVSDLLRVTVVEVDGLCAALPDHHRRHPGRGASLHPVLVCLDLAERRRAFPRALRHAGPLSIVALRDWINALPSNTLNTSNTDRDRKRVEQCDERSMSTQ